MSRILVVDEHEPVRRSILTLLGAREGWVLCGEASDGIQAVKEAKSLRPDLIIMDVSMPNMNGLDAARIILREVRESRILIISQNDPAIARLQALEARAQTPTTVVRDAVAQPLRGFRSCNIHHSSGCRYPPWDQHQYCNADHQKQCDTVE
jgi:DNA-binding NarL/FixJ family response regulator